MPTIVFRYNPSVTVYPRVTHVWVIINRSCPKIVLDKREAKDITDVYRDWKKAIPVTKEMFRTDGRIHYRFLIGGLRDGEDEYWSRHTAAVGFDEDESMRDDDRPRRDPGLGVQRPYEKIDFGRCEPAVQSNALSMLKYYPPGMKEGHPEARLWLRTQKTRLANILQILQHHRASVSGQVQEQSAWIAEGVLEDIETGQQSWKALGGELISHPREVEATKDSMYLHYSISDDRSGNDDAVKIRILSVLGEREERNSNKSPDLSGLSHSNLKETPDLSILSRLAKR